MKILFLLIILITTIFFISCDDGNEGNRGKTSCDGITCGDNGSCEAISGKASCECNKNFHNEEGVCVPNTKTVSCKVVSPPNAETMVVNTSIKWTENNNWEEPESCMWTCKDGFIFEDGYCVADFMTVKKNIRVEMPFRDFTLYHIAGSKDIVLNGNGEAIVDIFPVFGSVYLLDSNDDVVAVYKANLETKGNNIVITTETTAMGIIMAAPVDWKVYKETLTEIRQRIKSHPSFELMKERIYTIASHKPSLLIKDKYLIELAKEVLTDVRANLTLNAPLPSWLVSPVVTADAENNGIDKCNIKITNKRAIPYGISVLNFDDDDIYSGWGLGRFFWISGKGTFRYLTGFLPEDKTDPFYSNSIVKNMGFEGGNVTGTYKLNKAGHYYVCMRKFPFSSTDMITQSLQNSIENFISFSDILHNLDDYITGTSGLMRKNECYAELKAGAGIIPDIVLMVLGISSSNLNNSDTLSDAIKDDIKDFIKAMYDIAGNESNFKTSLDDLVNFKTLFTVGKSNTVKWVLKYLATKGLTHFIGKTAATVFKTTFKLAGLYVAIGQLGVMIIDSTAAEIGKCYNVVVDDSCNMDISEVTRNCDEIQCSEPTSCHSGICVLDDGRCMDDSVCNTNNGEYCNLDNHTCVVDPCYGLSYDNTYQHCENGMILTNEGLCSSNADCEADETCGELHFCIKNIVRNCENVTCGYKGRCYIESGEAKCYCYRGYQDNDNNLVCSPSCFADTCTGEHMTGVCDDSSGVVICECAEGYSGDNCELEINHGEMVNIPEGTFMMGCNDAVDTGCDSDERPVHRVRLSAFKIDKYEVTVAQFRECVEAGACSRDNFKTSNDDISFNYGNGNRENHPMNGVNWYGAKEYCEWLGKRLPTEAEWEYAARGTDGRIYPWGNESPTCNKAVYGKGNGGACYTGNEEIHTMAVGSKSLGKSPFGLYDMAGNVWEWVEDCYQSDYYASGAAANPLNDNCNFDTFRVLRGGGLNFEFYYLRASFRYYYDPLVMLDYNGFRCAKSQ